MKEYLDIVDEKGNPTGETVERSLAHGEGIRHRTAHLWLIRQKEGSLQILLQKRSADKDSHPGSYDISSAGHIPAGVGYTASAVRELEEELGITASEEELICCGDRKILWDDVFHGKPFHDRQVSRVFLLWRDLEEDAFTVQKEEVEHVCWMDFEECIQGVRENTFHHCIALEELLMVKKVLEEHTNGIDI